MISLILLCKMRDKRLSNLISYIGSRFFRKMVFRIYRINNLSTASGRHFIDIVNKQSYQDLMLYNDKFPHLSRRSLLIEAMDKFKSQEKLYSISENGQLQSYAWMKQTRDDSTIFETHIPAGAFIFQDFYIKDGKAGEDSFAKLIACMLEDAHQEKDKQIYLLMRKNSALKPGLLKNERLHSMIELSKVFILTALTSKRRRLQSFNT